MKGLLTILLLLTLKTVFAQPAYTPINSKQRFTKALGFPVRDTASYTSIEDTAVATIQPTNGHIYHKYKGVWIDDSQTGAGEILMGGTFPPIPKFPQAGYNLLLDSTSGKYVLTPDTTTGHLATQNFVNSKTYSLQQVTSAGNATTLPITTARLNTDSIYSQSGTFLFDSVRVKFVKPNYAYPSSGVYDIIAIGDSALINNQSYGNLGIGTSSLKLNTTGYYNSGIGQYALTSNTTGNLNTAEGYSSLYKNTTGIRNSGFGAGALEHNTIGTRNTAFGQAAMQGGYNSGNVPLDITGSYNTSIGASTLIALTAGYNNVAVGYQAGNLDSIGFNNTYVGTRSGSRNGSGWGNIFIGYESGRTQGDLINRLIITNKDTSAPLIMGDFAAASLTINGKLQSTDTLTATTMGSADSSNRVATTAWVRRNNSSGGTGGAVSSVFGRTGAVVAANGDYAFSQIGSKPSTLSGYGITDAYPLTGNPSGFLTSVPAQSFSSLLGKPTTLSGYGITDAYPLSGNPSNFLTGITGSQVTTALGFTPYNATNPAGYITSSFAASAYQPTLGFTPENVANKATSFATINNTLYPTTQAIVNYLAAQPFAKSVTVNGSTFNADASGNVNIGSISGGSGGTGTVTNVSSSTSDITITNSATTPLLTLNSLNGITKSYYDPTSSIQTQLNSKQPLLGFSPENTNNKATSLVSPNNTTYPTTQAVASYVSAQVPSTHYVYAEDYGLVGDGATVNTEAQLLSFYNACTGTGKVGVFKTNGVYLINITTNQCEIHSTTQIEGNNATLRLSAGSTSPRYLTRIYAGKNKISIKNLTFDANNANQTGADISAFFVEENQSDLTFDHVTFMGGKTSASSDFKGTSSTPITNLKLINCIWTGAGNSAIDLRGLNGVDIVNPLISSWGTSTASSAGIKIQSIACNNITISNGTFNNTVGTQFAIESSGSSTNYTVEDAIITGNTFNDPNNLGGNGISGYFNHSTFSSNLHVGGANNQRGGYEIFGSHNKILNNTIGAGSIVAGAGSVTGLNATDIEIAGNNDSCAVANGSALVVSGYGSQTVSKVKIHDNVLYTLGGSGNSSTIKLGTYATTSPISFTEVYGNTLYSSAYGVRLEAAAGSTNVSFFNNHYRQGNQMFGVMNDNTAKVFSNDNFNGSGSDSVVYTFGTPTNPIIFSSSATTAERLYWNNKGDSLRNNAGVLEMKKNGVFVPQLPFPAGGINSVSMTGVVTAPSSSTGALVSSIANNAITDAMINSVSASKVTGLAAVATTGSFNSLLNQPGIQQVANVSNTLSLASTGNFLNFQNSGNSLNGGISLSSNSVNFNTATASQSTSYTPSGITSYTNSNSSTVAFPDYGTSASHTLVTLVNGKYAQNTGSIYLTESDIPNLVTDLGAKQATLVSGTNLRTVYGNTLLGSTDVPAPTFQQVIASGNNYNDGSGNTFSVAGGGLSFGSTSASTSITTDRITSVAGGISTGLLFPSFGISTNKYMVVSGTINGATVYADATGNINFGTISSSNTITQPTLSAIGYLYRNVDGTYKWSPPTLDTVLKNGNTSTANGYTVTESTSNIQFVNTGNSSLFGTYGATGISLSDASSKTMSIATTGIVLPSYTTTQMNSLSAPVAGQLIWNSTATSYYAYNGSAWTAVGNGSSGITALTGDVTASGTGSVAATLASSGVTAGSYTNANITVDAKGRIISASNGTGGGAVSSVSNSDGTLTISPTTGAVVASLNQAITPTWTGVHTHNANVNYGTNGFYDLTNGKFYVGTQTAVVDNSVQAVFAGASQGGFRGYRTGTNPGWIDVYFDGNAHLSATAGTNPGWWITDGNKSGLIQSWRTTANGSDLASISNTGAFSGAAITATNGYFSSSGVALDLYDVGITKDDTYKGLMSITRATTANQYMAFVKAGTQAVSLGFINGQNYQFGIGGGATTDANFTAANATAYFDVVANKTYLKSLQIADGTQAANKVLTSDASGNTSWGLITTSNISATAGIANTQLANSSINVNGVSAALGGTITVIDPSTILQVGTSSQTITTFSTGKLLVECSYNSGATTITLPSASSCTGKDITIKAVTSAVSITISGTYPGDTNASSIASGSFGALTYRSDGTYWHCIAKY